MSKALVKWHPRETEAGNKMDTALQKLHRSEGLGPPRQGQAALSPAPSPRGGEVVDVPRICALHNKPSAARYVAGSDGRFRYAQSIRVTESLYLGQYADNTNRQLVPASDIGDETCPWCGASGFGSVRCGTCGKEICYGKTTGRYFRCRDSCGGQGVMVSEDRRHEGVTPNSPRGGGYAAPGGK
ncbi:MAG: hypothetical protein ACLPWF_29995 [Bryobacteraceae bacterium]|jgi:hypothetical protein